MAFYANEYRIDNLLSNNLLMIPRNQRKYVWNKNNWSDILSDIKFVVDNPGQTEHFLGSIVLSAADSTNGIPKFDIIDGQQRTITIIIFLLALIKIFQENDSEGDVEGTFQYLYVKDRKNNQHMILVSEGYLFLRDIAESIRTESSEKKGMALFSTLTYPKSETIIKNAFEFFYNELSGYTEDKGIEYVVRIKDALLDAKYIRINAYSDSDAYTVFEILNARGQSLEDFELLKNYIMRYIHPKEKVDEVKVRWAEIERILGAQMKTFFRHFVTHKFGTGDVYRTIQSKYPKENVSSLLNELYRKANLYKIILQPDNDRDNEEFEILTYLKSKRSMQLRPLILSLLSAYEAQKIDKDVYLSALRFLKNFFICFTIISSQKSNKLTDVIEKYGQLIEREGSSEVLSGFVESMKRKLPSLETFIGVFKDLGYSNHYDFYNDQSKRTQSFAALELIESYMSPYTKTNALTIEHIIPDSDSKESATIGNLTLLEPDINRKCKNLELAKKITYYMDSNIRMTRNIASRYGEHPEKFNIGIRAELMAKMIYNDILKLAE